MHRLVFLLCLSFVYVRSQNLNKIENLVDKFIYDEANLFRIIKYGNDEATRSTVLQFYEIYMSDIHFGEIGIFQMISREWSNDYDTLEFVKHIVTVNKTFAEARTLIEKRSYADILEFVNEMPRSIKSDYSRFLLRDSAEHYWSVIRNASRICDSDTRYILAESQVLREVYKEILAHLLKSYILHQFTNAVLVTWPQKVGKLHGGNGQRAGFRSTVTELKNRIFNYESESKNFSREMWTCDPNGFKLSDEQDSFIEVPIPYQGFISNEINLNSNRNCRQSCSDYTKTRQFVCDVDSSCTGKYSVKKEFLCNGTIEKCVRMPYDITVCAAPSNSSRRYDFIKYDGGNVMGVERNCVSQFNLVSHWYWFYKCDNCLCYCNDEDNPSTVGRRFSLRDVTSDIVNNLIVTGVGITTVNHTIQLTILQQKLLPKGVLNTTNDHKHSDWITSSPLNVTDDQPLIENKDYVVVTRTNRSVALTSVTIAKNDHVVTGVRFRVQDGKIGIEVRATRFDFERGMLMDIGNSFWMGNGNRNWNELVVDRPDVPTKTVNKSQMFAENNEFIQFQPSDMGKDGAQTTVPYLDTSTVSAYVPLSGVGLYYKSTSGYGGFIAPKLITFDFGRIRNTIIGLWQRPFAEKKGSNQSIV